VAAFKAPGFWADLIGCREGLFLIISGFICLFINIDLFDMLFTLSNVYFVKQREQMLEAQEMFRTANKVTRPEKALILGFMAGSRGE